MRRLTSCWTNWTRVDTAVDSWGQQSNAGPVSRGKEIGSNIKRPGKTDEVSPNPKGLLIHLLQILKLFKTTLDHRPAAVAGTEMTGRTRKGGPL